MLIFDNCLIGFAIKPAAVKKATKVSASSDMPNCAHSAKYATIDKEIDTRT